MITTYSGSSGVVRKGGSAMFDKNVLKLDPSAEAGRIIESLREQVFGQLRRRGAVVGISGGVDSSVVAALCTSIRRGKGSGTFHARTPFIGRCAHARPDARRTLRDRGDRRKHRPCP